MPARKLTEEQVYQIRRRYRSGEKQHVLARDFAVCERTIHFVVRGRIATRYGNIPLHRAWSRVPPIAEGFKHQYRRKLKPHQVIEARKRYQNGERLATLARSYGLTHPNMRKLLLRMTYKWVT